MSNYQNERSGVSRLLDFVLSLALIAGAGCGCWYVYSNGVKITEELPENIAVAAVEPEPTEDPNAARYEGVEVSNADVYNGPLILVNNDLPCMAGEDNLVSLYEKKVAVESQSFSVRDSELMVNDVFADAIITMCNDFNAETGDDNLLVLSGYRSEELQQQLYDEDLAATGLEDSDRVSKPGYSEHQTGYSIDLSLYGGEYDGTGIYSWIDEHCAEYGIILRYPDDKQDITNVRFEPWHYRYVGKPHAAYIMQNQLCLEEYINLIETTYPYEGEHLYITDTDGMVYEVYYYAMDHDYDSTMVAVPVGTEYTICGTNSDGFIVTAATGSAAPEEVPADAAAPEEVPADAAAPEEIPADAAAPAEVPADAAAPAEG